MISSLISVINYIASPLYNELKYLFGIVGLMFSDNVISIFGWLINFIILGKGLKDFIKAIT